MNDTNKIKLRNMRLAQSVTSQPNPVADAKFSAHVAAAAAVADSNARQCRIFRKLGKPLPEAVTLWESLMALRASIDREVLPTLLAARKAEEIEFQIKSAPTAPKPKAVSAVVLKPKLKGFEYTPAWWAEAEEREKAASRAKLEAAYA